MNLTTSRVIQRWRATDRARKRIEVALLSNDFGVELGGNRTFSIAPILLASPAEGAATLAGKLTASAKVHPHKKGQR